MTLDDALLKVGVYYCISPFAETKRIIKVAVCKVGGTSSTIREDNEGEFECTHGSWSNWPAFTNYWLAYAESLKGETEHEGRTVHS